MKSLGSRSQHQRARLARSGDRRVRVLGAEDRDDLAARDGREGRVEGREFTVVQGNGNVAVTRIYWARGRLFQLVVDGTAVTDPAVAAALKKLFAKDNAGYKPAKYYPNKAEARRVWVKCCLERNYGCPKACRIDFAGGKATIIPNNHDHEHPDRGSDELLNPKRGLSKIIKGLIDKHCENVSWCITDIMDHLKKKGALENYDEDPDHFLDKIKGYVKRKKAAVQGFKWRTSYAELKEAVEEMSKSDQDIEAMVMQKDWLIFFCY